ncbi:MAG: hypothetical protein HC883_01910 [Bdellovibrionaceae bacterium]|nr:hypothetical protein [Pseudobdellovibrionaceae bacterium]
MRMAIAILLLFTSSGVFAAPGVQEPVHANYKDPYDTIGLCTGDSKKYHFYKSGHCDTILETLTKNECTKRKLEEIRLRILGDEKALATAKIKNKDTMSLPFYCQHKTDGRNIENDIAKDPDKFALLMMQFFAMIAIEESNWRVLNNGNSSQSPSVKCTNNCGLFGLDKADMEKPEYACGCEIENKTDKKQFDPTMDGHLNLRCGITMALFEATKGDNTSVPAAESPKVRIIQKTIVQASQRSSDPCRTGKTPRHKSIRPANASVKR